MKRIVLFLIALSVLMLSLTACGSKVNPEDAEALSGKWILVVSEKGGVKDVSVGDTTLQFDAKGKVYFNQNGKTEKYDWNKNDGIYNIWVKDGAVKRGRTFVLEGDTLTLYWKDGNNESVKMTFGREGTGAVSPAEALAKDTEAEEKTEEAMKAKGGE